MSGHLALVLVFELATVLLSAPVGHALRREFSTAKPLNAGWLLTAYALFCATIWICRRLPHDQDAFSADSNYRKASAWSAASVLFGPLFLLFAAAHVAFGNEAVTTEHPVTGLLGGCAGPFLLVLIFLPMVLLWAQSVRPIARPYITTAEVAALTCCAFVSLVAKSYFEWIILDQRPDSHPLEADNPWAWLGLLVLGPLFLTMFGGPRLLLLARRFSRVEAAVIVLSTALYFLSGFRF